MPARICFHRLCQSIDQQYIGLLQSKCFSEQMGACIKETEPKHNDGPGVANNKTGQLPFFRAKIRELHKDYVKLVLYVRQSRLFETRNDKLVAAVNKYFESQFVVPNNEIDVTCVDMVRKLHPRDYWFTKVDQEWLIGACLRQQKFSDQTRVQNITFDHAYPEYLEFLRLCRYNFRQKNGAITVPTKCQDVIWHSHMQDAINYKEDMIGYMGKLLNHMDDIPDEELKKHSIRTNELKQELNTRAENKAGVQDSPVGLQVKTAA